jgi:uncharacterized membrane protein
LELELRRQNIAKLQEVLADYNEHFEMGLAKGKSEEEIVDKLGDPVTIAKAYQAENLISQMQESPVQDQFGYFVKAVLRILILTPFNFFMMIGPFLVTLCMLIAGWATALSLGGTGIGLAFGLFALIPIAALGFWSGGALLFSSLTVVGLSLLGLIVMFFVTKWILQLFVRYLQWNVNFVKGSKS